ncbi:MAG: cysteine hydrolase family protein [Thermomicrobiales bacterium]
MADPLLIVDLQEGFINDFTRHIPGRVKALIERDDYAPLLFTRFINVEGSPFRRFVGWHDCASSPETDLVPEMAGFAREELTFSKLGYAGISEPLATYLRDHRFERVYIAGIDTDMCVLKVALDIFDLNIEPLILADCCASTSGLQSHLAGLAILARNIGADKLRDAGLPPLSLPKHDANDTHRAFDYTHGSQLIRHAMEKHHEQSPRRR